MNLSRSHQQAIRTYRALRWLRRVKAIAGGIGIGLLISSPLIMDAICRKAGC